MSSLPASVALTDRLVSARHARPVNVTAVVGAAGLLAAGALYLGATIHLRQAVLFLIGGIAGVTLYHAAFGFTSAWRDFLVDRRGAGLRAQMLMLALACALFVPALAWGSALVGGPVRGATGALGLAVVAGAFIFGIGMQLGGG